jgi:hypothetical protein
MFGFRNYSMFKMARERLGLRQPSAALRRKANGGKAAEGCRSPKPCGKSNAFSC